MKYIIKNCPCYCEGTVVKGNQKLTKVCESIRRTIEEGEYRLENCCNISNCKIKQIVELCKKAEYRVFNHKYEVIGTKPSPLAQKILNLLEIEEVE